MWKFIFIILAVLYALNPYDFVPDLIVGWGWLDDLIILGLLWRYLSSQKNRQFQYRRFYQQPRGTFKNQGRRFDSGPHQSDSEHQNTGTTTPWDPYGVLKIDRKASSKEIKQAYRELAIKYHPDKLEHLGAEFKALAEKRFKDIQRAYEELTK